MDLSKALETPTSTGMEQIDPETGEVTVVENITAPAVKVEGEFDFDALDNATVGISFQPTYWSPSKAGQTSRGYYQGTSTITKNEPSGAKEITVVLWLTREGLLMNGGAAFVKLFDDVQQGTPIQLEYTGKESTQSGHKVNTFKLNMLNM